MKWKYDTDKRMKFGATIGLEIINNNVHKSPQSSAMIGDYSPRNFKLKDLSPAPWLDHRRASDAIGAHIGQTRN